MLFTEPRGHSSFREPNYEQQSWTIRSRKEMSNANLTVRMVVFAGGAIED